MMLNTVKQTSSKPCKLSEMSGEKPVSLTRLFEITFLVLYPVKRLGTCEPLQKHKETDVKISTILCMHAVTPKHRKQLLLFFPQTHMNQSRSSCKKNNLFGIMLKCVFLNICFEVLIIIDNNYNGLWCRWFCLVFKPIFLHFHFSEFSLSCTLNTLCFQSARPALI